MTKSPSPAAKPIKNITQFFAEAAVRKGAPLDLVERLNTVEVNTIADGGTNYKFDYVIDEESEETFCIYGDGTFGYDSPTLSITGKLAPPHSKTWIRRMIKSGMGVDFAKMIWAECYSIRHGGGGRMR